MNVKKHKTMIIQNNPSKMD